MLFRRQFDLVCNVLWLAPRTTLYAPKNPMGIVRSAHPTKAQGIVGVFLSASFSESKTKHIVSSANKRLKTTSLSLATTLVLFSDVSPKNTQQTKTSAGLMNSIDINILGIKPNQRTHLKVQLGKLGKIDQSPDLL